jgi:hypothetical protein
MALTVGIQGSSATPATDFYAILNTKLTALGWLNLAQIAAATAGTTDVVEVWHSAATVIAGTIYTGCIIFIETDNTNSRIRLRVSEVYDSSVAGSPANRVKWAAAGITTSSTATTPAASYAMADTFGPLFVTAATTSKVGWVEIPTSIAGFAYWVGGGASRLLVCNNSGGNPHFCLAGGPIETLLASSDSTSVYLMGGYSTAGGSDPSWAISTSNCGNIRTSREPLSTVSVAGAFVFQAGRAIPDSMVSNVTDCMGALGFAHRYHTTFIVSPAVMHGMSGSSWGTAVARSHRAIVTGLVVTGCPSNGAIAGDTITAGGTTYTVIGSSVMNGNAAINHLYAVDASAF